MNAVARNVRWIVAYVFVLSLIACFGLVGHAYLDNKEKAFPLLLKLNQLYSFPVGVILAALLVRRLPSLDVTAPQAILTILLAVVWNFVLVAESFLAFRSHVDASISLDTVGDLVDRTVSALNWLVALVLGFLYAKPKSDGAAAGAPGEAPRTTENENSLRT